mmetsp:Transcript_62679/g.136115  ORF Transcript_62679/g.136115 Transcript_62679/m.136115 type:complete len:335 (-) Transcript_62679:49-1053(-)|eukprot:CAMPEP_0170604868 /NCGR_PEP_ID=MMETSP0224-20130122/19666_1 /TAXON_ID=285029 /ORGANISM="Togula jolla, Strain CCCM 725" /LENGTH=334 /DNA_ID=CAMNT_0010929827 /DNA_START=52 /DNA_END=1056 /DNA_ORIENTATION=+
MRVAVFSAASYVREQLAPLLEEYPGSFFIDATCTPLTSILCGGAEAVCAFVNDDLSRVVIQTFAENGVKLILLRCAGYDRVDLAAVKEFGIKVARVPAYSPYAVAEQAFALALTLNRKIHQAYNRVREGNFMLNGLVGFNMHGKTIGIVGTGKIGRIAAQIFQGLGMDLLAYDVYKNNEIEEMGGRYVELDELYRTADVISLHTPLLPETRHMINMDTINKMKDGVLIINVSRGGLIDTGDVIKGLKSGKIGGVGLDVYEHEGPLFFQNFQQMGKEKRIAAWDEQFSVLRSFPNVIVTPHTAFLTKEALRNICDTTIMNAQQFEKGEPLTNEVK